MRLPVFTAPILLVAMASASVAYGQSAEAPAPPMAEAPAPATVSAPAKAEGQAAGEIRRDPKGVKGISPFWEVLKRGDAAYLARDYEQAIRAYAEALSKEPRNPMGHYRLGEAHLAKGDMQKAEASWQDALNVLGRDPALRAKILFVLADLRERQRNLPQARQGWSAYEGYLKGEPKAAGHSASAAERKKRIDEWVELEQSYAAVKERIAKRLAEVEEQKKKNAK